MVVYSFLFFLAIFVMIGVLSTLKSQSSNSDYLLAGGEISPWLAGLSAVATNNSGYMFIGMIGYTYASGVQSIWVLIAWLAGDFAASLFVHKKLRTVSGERNLLSFGGVLSRWHGTDYRRLRLLVGILTIIFLGVYAAAQLKAGSKALHVLFGWDYSLGAIIGSIIVFAYCLAGGIRASIWTDAAQSITMFFAMGLLCYVGIDNNGGWSMFLQKLNNVSPSYLDFFPNDLIFNNAFGMLIFVLGWFFGGLGVIGQPHIMVRFMTVKNPESIKKTKGYYYGWYFIFCCLTFGVGLTARLIFPDTSAFDKELALPMMGQQLLPEVLTGVILAGIFSATMSTADSQILSCSAAFSRDILPREKDTLWITKFTTAMVTLLALGIALGGTQNVFNLVLISWSILGAAFGPLLFLYTIEKKVSESLGILMIVNSIIVTILWRELGLNASVYEAAPGILTGIATYFLFRKWLPN
ncbi:MAG: sodium/proline symporter [Halobacteriovoraceae bacterium]|nr:sodium/proline symporter [Halobacteriovoraceae bacterium]